MTETITPQEAHDKFWEISLNAFKWIILFVLGIILTTTRITFTLLKKFLALVIKANEWAEAYQPATPGIFGGKHENC
jgi:hypothetical protein